MASGRPYAICNSFTPRCRQITMPVPHHSVSTGHMPFLSRNQQRQSTEGTLCLCLRLCSTFLVSHWCFLQILVHCTVSIIFFINGTCCLWYYISFTEMWTFVTFPLMIVLSLLQLLSLKSVYRYHYFDNVTPHLQISTCTIKPRWTDGEFLVIVGPAFPASRVQHTSDLHSKFALRPHHV